MSMTIKADHWSKVPSGMWRWPNFSPRELASKDDGSVLLDVPTLDKLQALRRALDKPMIVISAYRTPAHNAKVGGAKDSFHMQGKAFDIAIANHNPAEFIKSAKAFGFSGIGTYPKQGFIHIDTGPTRTWGDPFPASPATSLPEEPKMPPVGPQPVPTETKVVVGAGAVLVAAEVLAMLPPEIVPVVHRVVGELPVEVQPIATIGLAGLLAWVLWRRRDGQ
jgi:hypothetical protein